LQGALEHVVFDAAGSSAGLVEVLEIVVEAGVALAGGVAGAGGVLWSLARKLQSIEDVAKSAEKVAKENREKVDKLEVEIHQDRRQGAEQWQDLNRTLGQIEGMMSGSPMPTRPRLPSR
jgi:3-dehydroquinate synthase class II